MTSLKSIITEDIITDSLNDIVATKFQCDNAAFGGVMVEIKLSSNLRKSGYIVYTQKEVETLYSMGHSFEFGGLTMAEFKKAQKDITSPYYASDIFLFSKVGNTFILEDWVSLKTSINDNDGSKVFIVNDAEGYIYPRILSGDVDFKIGKVLIISMNTVSLNYSADWFGDTVGSITSLFSDMKVEEGKVSFNLKDSVFKGRSRQVITAMNRNSNLRKKATSFDRGFMVRRDFIPQLSRLGVFTNICSGSVNFDKGGLVEGLLTIG